MGELQDPRHMDERQEWYAVDREGVVEYWRGQARVTPYVLRGTPCWRLQCPRHDCYYSSLAEAQHLGEVLNDGPDQRRETC